MERGCVSRSGLRGSYCFSGQLHRLPGVPNPRAGRIGRLASETDAHGHGQGPVRSDLYGRLLAKGRLYSESRRSTCLMPWRCENKEKWAICNIWTQLEGGINLLLHLEPVPDLIGLHVEASMPTNELGGSGKGRVCSWRLLGAYLNARCAATYWLHALRTTCGESL